MRVRTEARIKVRTEAMIRVRTDVRLGSGLK